MGKKHCHHHHDLQGRRLVIAIVLNLAVVAAEVWGGVVSGSLALLSDALHNFSDVLSLFITLFAIYLARQKNSLTHTFGYKRAEIIAALVNAAILLVVVFFLVKEAWQRFYTPIDVEAKWVVACALLSILINGLCVLLLKKDSADSLNIRSAYWHLFADMLTSIGVLIGGGVIWLLGWQWVDSIITVIIAVYLLYIGWQLLKETTCVLMQFSPPYIQLAAVERVLSQHPAVRNLHHVHCWQLDDNHVHFEAHVQFVEDLKLSEASAILVALKNQLKSEFDIGHAVLEPNINIDGEQSIVLQDCHE